MKYIAAFLLILLFPVFTITQCSKSKQEQTADKKVEQSLEQQVGLLFKEHCATANCHRGERPKKKLDLEPNKFVASTVDVASLELPDLKLIDTLEPENSYLLKKVRGDEDIVDDRMPEDAPSLTPEQIQLILDWALELQASEQAADSTSSM
ncbi:hypothetical protein JW960_20655 [candidate division KSB1 bacterium]|nr:hypothetical protein [candidate division KSB1 bacterium]